MGWLHVIGSGKGVYLEKCSKKFCNLGEISLCFESYEEEIEKMLGEYSEKLEMAENLSLSDKILVWSEQKIRKHDKFRYRSKAPEKYTKEYLDENFSNRDKRRAYLDAMAEIFCQKYGYPKNTFCCLSDYEGDKMFYCCAYFPFPENSGALLQLTEEKYKAQLEELIGNLTGEKVAVKLEICEEYVKE